MSHLTVGSSHGVWIVEGSHLNQTDDAYSNLLVRCIEFFIVCFANDYYEQLYKYSCLDWKSTEG